jgi:hypothetical protein
MLGFVIRPLSFHPPSLPTQDECGECIHSSPDRGPSIIRWLRLLLRLPGRSHQIEVRRVMISQIVTRRASPRLGILSCIHAGLDGGRCWLSAYAMMLACLASISTRYSTW